MPKIVTVRNIKIGGKNQVVLIAGPCVIESRESTLRHAKALKGIAKKLDMPFIFKSSYDKANRTSINSYRGPGLKRGLDILKEVKEKVKVPILSDIHCREEVRRAAGVLDVIQIPAFLSRQTDLLLAAAATQKVINVKKAQFMAPWDVKNVVEKIESTRNRNILLTERGASFGYNTLVSDFRAILIMKKLGYPIVFDATHSVQSPGGQGASSGGDSEFIEPLSLAAVSCGVDALFIEVHENPDKALSDGPNTVKLKDLEGILKKIKRVEKAIGR